MLSGEQLKEIQHSKGKEQQDVQHQKQKLEDEINKLKQSVIALEEDIKRSTEEEKRTIDVVDSYLKHIKKCYYERISAPLKNSCEQIIDIYRLLEKATIKGCLVGTPGSGKSTWLNTLLGCNLLPTGGEGNHITKCVLEVVHGSEYQVQEMYVSEDGFKSRIEMLKTKEEKDKHKFQQYVSKTTNFNNNQELADFINDFSDRMSYNRILLVQKLIITTPSMEDKLIICDTPGLGSSDGEPYRVLAEETAKNSDVVFYFTLHRHSEMPIAMQDFVGSVASDNAVQVFPPSFKFMCGGVNMHASANKLTNFLDTFSRSKEMQDKFQDMVSLEFDYLFDKDNLPKERIGNHELLVDIKEFCTNLITNFGTITIPYSDTEFIAYCQQLSYLNFKSEITKEIKKKLFNTKVKIRDHIIGIIPDLNRVAKMMSNITSEKDDKCLIDLETLLKTEMDNIIASFPKIKDESLQEETSLAAFIQIFKKLSSSLDKRVFRKVVNNFLTSDAYTLNETNRKRSKNESNSKKNNKIISNSVYFLINSCKKFIESKKCEWENKKYNSLSNSERKKHLDKDIKEISKHFETIFNPKNEHRFVLATKIQNDLSSIFQNYQAKVYFEYEYNIDTALQIPKKKQGKLVLPVKDLNYGEYVSLNMIAPNDYCHDHKIEPHALSTISNVLIEQSPQTNSNESSILPQTTSAILIPTIVINQDNKTVSFKDPPVIENLGEFQDFFPNINNNQSRIHPVFIIAHNGEREYVVPNLLFTSLHQECTVNVIPHLIFIVTLKKNVPYYKKLVGGKSNYHIIAIENNSTLNISYHFLETICLMLSSKYFKFNIITITNEDVGKIYEYLPKLKILKSEKFTFIRYLRFIESLIQHEVSLKEDELEKKLENLFDKQFSDTMFDTNNAKIMTSGCKVHAQNPSVFLNLMRKIDQEHNTELERKFMQAMYSLERGKFSIKTKINDNRMYNVEKTNYIQGNFHEDITTYFMPAMNDIYPVSDAKFFHKLKGERTEIKKFDNESSAAFRATMLFNGIASFHCFTYSYAKNYNEDEIIELDYSSESDSKSDSDTSSRPRKFHKRSENANKTQ